jgi:hypothetical protein
MLYLAIQRGKHEMPKWSDQYRELGATTSCSVRATTKMANCGQKKDEHHRNLILAYSWLQVLEDKLKTWPCRMNLTLEATSSKG